MSERNEHGWVNIGGEIFEITTIPYQETPEGDDEEEISEDLDEADPLELGRYAYFDVEEWDFSDHIRLDEWDITDFSVN